MPCEHLEFMLHFRKLGVSIYGNIVSVFVGALVWFVGVMAGIFPVQLEADVHEGRSFRYVVRYNTVYPYRCSWDRDIGCEKTA